ncbi:MAG: cadmium-translocating P-type ATPase [Alphaproteobacteria bacterium]|nr:cadmium-translocating P-type ATPase [Alphaproteobacteria bacterium]
MAAPIAPRVAVCPTSIVPLPEQNIAATKPSLKADSVLLSLPTIHCAGCISTVERGLAAIPGVRAARVNLSLKRVSVDAKPSITAAQLVETLAALGYEAHELDPSLLSTAKDDLIGRNLLMRLAVAAFAMMNVLLLSIAVWAGADGVTRDFMHWISALIALPAIAFSAQPFFRNGWQALRKRHLNMDVPISLALILAAGMSLFETMNSGENAYFDAALSLTFFLLAGRYLDHRTRASARSAAQELAALEVPRALLQTSDGEKNVPIQELRIGDTIIIKPGARIPVDAEIITGETEIDRAFLTGESLPVYAGPTTSLHAGEINLTGPITLRVTAIARHSTLQKITDLVALAETSRDKYTSLADRAAAIYAPGVHLLALAAFIGWFTLSGDLRLSLNIAIAVLIITCPCALGLAVPAVNTAASGRLFRKGVLLKSGTALERLAEIDTVVFDKTGTLTLGIPTLIAPQNYPPDALKIAAALAKGSAHPLAQSILRAAKSADIEPSVELIDLKETPGFGVEATLDGTHVRLGRAAWVGANEAETTASFLKIGDQPAVKFTFIDELRPGVADLIKSLKALGIEVHMLTGDSPRAAADVAARLGITNIAASQTPQNKADLLRALGEAGKKVLMLGDGLNDTGALASAHVSIAPACAIDAARVASDIVILKQDFGAVSDCLKTARSSRARIKENFAMAAAYNAVAVPIALLGFATPLIAALAMSASSITVTINAWRVR